jgi:hypothetical protein
MPSLAQSLMWSQTPARGHSRRFYPLALAVLRRARVISRNEITGILCIQWNFSSFSANPENPIAVWEGVWTTTDFSPRQVALTTETRGFDVYIQVKGPLTESRMSILTEGQAFIRVVPAPVTAAVLGVIFAIGRRRRKS